MKIKIPYFPALLLIILIGFTMCKKDEEKMPLMFSGQVTDEKNNGVDNALIEVGEKDTKTDEKGFFKIAVEPSKRYVLNVTKMGFGLVSKIYMDTTSNILIKMTTATIQSIEPEVQEDTVVVEDTTPPPPESAPLSSTIENVSSPLDTIAFIINRDGRLIGFGAPHEVADTYDAAADFDPQNEEGATVEIVPDDLEEDPDGGGGGAFASFFSFFQDNNDEKREITASISTIDVYSPDGMPGDFTIESDGKTSSYMETFGAVDINFTKDGKPLQLKKGKSAKITIPIDQITRKYFGKELPKTMKLWVYDKKEGIWKRDGKNEGVLNERGTAYEAKITHFSVFNMDEEFADPACYNLCTPVGFPTGLTGAKMEVAVPGHVKPFYPFQEDCPGSVDCAAGTFAHAVVRMAQNSPMGIRIADNAGVVKLTYVVIAGGSAPAFPPCDYGDCSGPLNIEDITTIQPYMLPDGTMSRPLVAVEEAGTDLRVSWIYVPEVSGTDYTTTAGRTYTIEIANDIGFSTIVGSQVVGPNTDWINSELIPMATIDGWIDSEGTNSDSHYIRVKAQPGTASPLPVDSDDAGVCFFHPDSGLGSGGDGGLGGC